MVEKVNRSREIILTGISVSEGLALGSICVYHTELDDVQDIDLDAEQVSDELDRYYTALNEVGLQFVEKQDRIARNVGAKQAEIYEAYRLILEDPIFLKEIPDAIKQSRQNAEGIIRKKLNSLEKKFDGIADEYLRERIYDIRGVSRRLIFFLMQADSHCDFDRYSENILMARELTPVDSIYFLHKSLKGIATEYGGKTSHAAILAHSLEIAAVVGVTNLMTSLKGVQRAAIDGYQGKIILNPSRETQKDFKQKIEAWEQRKKRLESLISVPVRVISGQKVKLMANINDDHELEMAQKYQADGVGLFRTELPFIARQRFLNEDEQVELYKKILMAFPRKGVTIRLLDMGGDKFLPYADKYHEANPFLGWRSIRILLQEREVLLTQLRALYRVALFGSLKIMIPMISSLEEILEVKAAIKQVQSDLKMTNIKVPLGIMVEVPSAAIEIEKLLKEVDFASLGTNDLIQYTLAVDRANEKVAPYYQPLSGAVLYLIEQVVKAGEKMGKEISICGEMAGEPLYVPLLLGLGLRHLSMHPVALTRVKNIISKTPDSIIEHLSKNYRRFSKTSELAQYLEANLKKIEANGTN
jgi:phosphotransferase system enzyme I (PtsI)